MPEGARICPLCEQAMDADVCPKDGCPTVDRSLFDEQEEILKPGCILAKRFEIVRHLGKGAMGSVFLGKQLSMSRLVAIKTLHRGMVSDQQMVKRFYLEARAASQLDHPNIIRIYDFGVDDDTEIPYIAMEYVDGATLGHHLPRGRGMPETHACGLLVQVAKALVEAHEKGIVHRDLKPDNIVVRVLSDGEEQVKVLDFGIAKVVRGGTDSMRDLTQTGMTLGTPAFMAPEQIRAAVVDFRADLYSMGCILHLLLAGENPFPGDDNLSVMLAHISDPVPTLPELLSEGAPPTDGLCRLHAALLQKSVDDRPHTTAGLARALATLARGEELDVAATLGAVGEPASKRPQATQPFDPHPLAATASAEAVGLAGTESAQGLHDTQDPLQTAKSLVNRIVPPAQPQRPSRAMPIAVGLAAAAAVAVFAWPGSEAPEPESPAATSIVPVAPSPEPAPAQAEAPDPTPVEPIELALPAYSIALDSAPSGAEVRDGDAVLGITPMTLTLAEGVAERRVTLSLPDHEPTTVLATRDTASTFRLTLRQTPTPPPAHRPDPRPSRRAKARAKTKPASSPAPKPKVEKKTKKKIQVW